MSAMTLRYRRLLGKRETPFRWAAALLSIVLAGSAVAQTAPRSAATPAPASTPIPERYSPHSVIKGSPTPTGGRAPGRLIAPTTGPITDGGQASNQFGRKVGAFSSTDPDGEAPAFMSSAGNLPASTAPVAPPATQGAPYHQGAGTLPPPSTHYQSPSSQRGGESAAQSPFTPAQRSTQTAPLPAPRQPSPVPSSYERSAAIDEIFRALSNRPQGVGVNIWFPGVLQYSSNELAQGSAVAQGIALRTGYAALNVTSVPNVLPGRFNVVIGTVAQLGGLVSESELKGNAIGHLILRPMPNRPDTHLLIVTGRSKEGVDSAILSLGLARQPLPRTTTAAINDIILPEAPPFLRREPLWANSIYTFEHLQAIGTQMVMLPSRRLRIEFMLPGDFSPEYPGEMQLHFHLSNTAATASTGYGRLGSVSIIANNQLQHPSYGEVQPLPQGGASALVNVPARLLQQGYNVLEVEFPGASLQGFHIYSDSTLTVPSWNTQPTLPNLYITSRTAYPFVGQPDGSEILVYVVGGEIEAFESAWTFLARLAQISNTMFYNTEYQVGEVEAVAVPNPQARHIIAVGTIDRIPEEYRVGMPEGIFRDVVKTPEVLSAEEEAPVRGVNLKDLIMRGKEAFLSYGISAPDPAPAPIPALEASPLPLEPKEPKYERGFLGSFPPLKNTHGWILMLTAETGALLKQRTDELVLPQFWDRLSGGSIYWSDTPESLHVYTAPVAAEKPLGAILPAVDENVFVEMPFGEKIQTRHWMIAVGITLLVLVLSAARTLRKITDARDYSI